MNAKVIFLVLLSVGLFAAEKQPKITQALVLQSKFFDYTGVMCGSWFLTKHDGGGKYMKVKPGKVAAVDIDEAQRWNGNKDHGSPYIWVLTGAVESKLLDPKDIFKLFIATRADADNQVKILPTAGNGAKKNNANAIVLNFLNIDEFSDGKGKYTLYYTEKAKKFLLICVFDHKAGRDSSPETDNDTVGLFYQQNRSAVKDISADANEADVVHKPDPQTELGDKYLNEGLALSRERKWDQAIISYTKSIEADPQLPYNCQAYINRGLAFTNSGKPDLAIADFNAVIKSFAGSTLDLATTNTLAGVYGYRGDANNANKKYELAIADYEKAIATDPNLAGAHNNLAWLLATCPSDDIRNGEKALAHASAACKLTKTSSPENLDTLAAAYAEMGDFDNAVSAQKAAFELMEDANEKKAFGLRLELYKSRKPYRQDK
jgi:tetratricopeptide (TPR) repeat protein